MADTSPGRLGVRVGPLGERWPASKLSSQLPQLLAPESQTTDGLAGGFAEATCEKPAFSNHEFKHNVGSYAHQESNRLLSAASLNGVLFSRPSLALRTFSFAVPGPRRDSPRGPADKMALGTAETGTCRNE